MAIDDPMTDDEVIDEVAGAIRRAWIKRSAERALWVAGQRKPNNHWRVMAMAAISALVPALESRNTAANSEQRQVVDECDD